MLNRTQPIQVLNGVWIIQAERKILFALFGSDTILEGFHERQFLAVFRPDLAVAQRPFTAKNRSPTAITKAKILLAKCPRPPQLADCTTLEL